MRITIITSPFLELPPIAIGAVEKLFYQLAGEWVKNGNEVAFVCCGGGDDDRMKFVRIKKYNRTGSTKKDIFWDLLYSIMALWKCPKTDILLCNTFWTPALAPLFRWKYKRLVYGVHRYPKGQFWLYPFVHGFICVSTAVADELKRQIGCRKEICTINNPVDVSVPQINRSKGGCDFVLVYAGRVHPEKGLDILFDAASILASKDLGVSIKLKIIGTADTRHGGGGDDYVNRLRGKAPNVDVEWVGAIYDSGKLFSEMSKGDCFVYPSIAEKGETFGVAPLEAMALGLPVVLSDLKCFSDFARPQVNSLQFVRGDHAAEQVADAVAYLIKNLDRAKEVSDRAKETAALFNKVNIASEYEAYFKEIF